MNITFECADKINGKITASIVKADYEEQVKKTVKFFHEKLMCFDKYLSEGAEEKLDTLKMAVQNH